MRAEASGEVAEQEEIQQQLFTPITVARDDEMGEIETALKQQVAARCRDLFCVLWRE